MAALTLFGIWVDLFSTAAPNRKRGRPRKPKFGRTILTAPDVRGRGRRAKYAGLLEWVEQRKAESRTPLSDAQVLREAITEALRDLDPAKHRLLIQKRNYFVSEGDAPTDALRKAVDAVEGAHFRKLRVILSQARHGR